MVASGSSRFGDRQPNSPFDVAWGGRVYPDRPSGLVGGRDKVHNLRTDPNHPLLADRLTESLWQRLPFAVYSDALPEEPDALMQSYLASLAQIHRMQREVLELVYKLCQTNLEFRQQAGTTDEPARERAIQDKIEEVLSRAGLPLVGPKNVLTATLATQPLVHLHDELLTNLRQAVRQFADQVEHALQDLAAEQLIGLVEWVGPNACQYHFFKEVLIQENDGLDLHSPVATGVAVTTSGAAHNSSTRKAKRVLQIQEIRRGRHIHRWARHEHHVVHAFQTSLENMLVEMPPAVEALAYAIPQWLTPEVAVIHGDIVCERIIECDYRREEWSSTSTREVPLESLAPDPAVVIGPYVLTAWGPREVQAETQRRAAIAANVWWNRLVWCGGTAVTVVGAIALWELWTGSGWAATRWAVPLTMLCLYAVMQTGGTHGRVTATGSGWKHHLPNLLTAVGFLAAGAFLVLGSRYLSFPDILLGGVLFLASVAGLWQGFFSRATTYAARRTV